MPHKIAELEGHIEGWRNVMAYGTRRGSSVGSSDLGAWESSPLPSVSADLR